MQFTINEESLKKLLNLDKSARETLEIFLQQFDKTLKGKLDRSKMDAAEKQKVKRGIQGLITANLIKKVPNKSANYMLNPYIFETLFNTFLQKDWDRLKLSNKNTSLFASNKALTNSKKSSTSNEAFGNTPSRIIVTHESFKKALSKHRNKPMKILTLDEQKEIQKINLEDDLSRIRKNFRDNKKIIKLNDNLDQLYLAIEEIKATIFQEAEGLKIHGQYDDSLPRYRFQVIIDKYLNDSNKSKVKIIKVRGKKRTITKINNSILYKLDHLKSIQHRQNCVDLMHQQNSTTPCCDCSKRAFNELYSCLFEDTWISAYSVDLQIEFQQWVKEWFMEYFPELVL